MPEASFTDLALVMAVAFLTPLVLGLLPRSPVPSVVAEVVLGIVVGPAVLGWVEADEVVRIVALVGLAFLLFLAGMELDLRRLRGTVLRLGLTGFAVSLALAGLVGLALDLTGLVDDALLAAVVLTATSLGLVIGVLKEAGQATTPTGQLIIAGASIGDVAAIVLLSVLFSADGSGTGAQVVLLLEYVAVVAAIAGLVALGSRSRRLSATFLRLQDTTAEIRVRGAVLLVVVLVVLAEHFGLETILGAFLAGAVVGLIDRDAAMTHPQFRVKLEAIGYGFLVPVFFVASGVAFDLDALLDDPATLVLVPVFLACLLMVRGVPAVVYRPVTGDRGAVAAGLLQATSLPFIVAATMIGVDLGALDPATAAAFVAAGLLSAVAFPAVAVSLLREPSWTDLPTSATMRHGDGARLP
jgi:Kef-type K+ transport system membrane component KefB